MKGSSRSAANVRLLQGLDPSLGLRIKVEASTRVQCSHRCLAQAVLSMALLSAVDRDGVLKRGQKSSKTWARLNAAHRDEARRSSSAALAAEGLRRSGCRRQGG
jgi:hypothetical protein